MKIEPKMSGWSISDYSIDTKSLPFENLTIITLNECQRLSQPAMDYLLDNFRFTKGETERWAIISHDDLYKIAILESYPEYEAELKEYFGEKWINYYLRFGH